jgi:uncharacterized protein
MMRSIWLRLPVVLTIILLLAGCPRPEPTVTLKAREFTVELAQNDADRARGLMFREAMPEDRGMLFIFDDEQMRSFWMHNCKISLDIFYFDAALKLVSVAENVPPCNLPESQCPNYPSAAPARYVLELNAGMAKRLDVQAGDELQLDLRQ